MGLGQKFLVMTDKSLSTRNISSSLIAENYFKCTMTALCHCMFVWAYTQRRRTVETASFFTILQHSGRRLKKQRHYMLPLSTQCWLAVSSTNQKAISLDSLCAPLIGRRLTQGFDRYRMSVLPVRFFCRVLSETASQQSARLRTEQNDNLSATLVQRRLVRYVSLIPYKFTQVKASTVLIK